MAEEAVEQSTLIAKPSQGRKSQEIIEIVLQTKGNPTILNVIICDNFTSQGNQLLCRLRCALESEPLLLQGSHEATKDPYAVFGKLHAKDANVLVAINNSVRSRVVRETMRLFLDKSADNKVNFFLDEADKTYDTCRARVLCLLK